jgi:hypothetical protein
MIRAAMSCAEEAPFAANPDASCGWRRIIAKAIEDQDADLGPLSIPPRRAGRPARSQSVVVTARDLVQPLLDAREVELRLFESLADSQLLGEKAHFLEPPIWEIGHVGWFQEYWLLRHLDNAAPLVPGADDIYDSFNVSYKLRWEHAYPSRGKSLNYISEILKRSIGRFDKREPTGRDECFYTLAALHEDMHAENLTLVLTSLGYAQPAVTPSATEPLADEAFRHHDVTVPGGTFMLGATPDEPFVFDNEKWAHPVLVKPFRLAVATVTNQEFQAFIDDSGYRRRELWSARGWDWRRRASLFQPLFWITDGKQWFERSFDQTRVLRPWHPVCGVSCAAAQHSPARIADGAAVQAGVGLDAVAPVGARVADAEEVADRDVDPDAFVDAARLEHQDGNRGVLGEAIGEHAPGGAAAGDHVVERAKGLHAPHDSGLTRLKPRLDGREPARAIRSCEHR